MVREDISTSDIIANIPGIVYRCLCDSDWTMVSVSEYIFEMSGYPASDFIDNRVRSFASIIYPQDRKHVEEKVLDALGKRTPYTIEYRIVRKDGRICWVYERGRGVFDREGKTQWLDGAIIDITEKKHIETRLADKERELSALMDNIPAYVFWKDRDSVFLGCNRNLATALGLEDPEEIIGKTDYDFSFSKEEADWYRKCDREVMEEDKPMINIEESQHREDGSERVLLTNKVPLKNEKGETVGMLGIFTDITDLKNAERELKKAREQLFQSEKMAAVGQLSAGVAHEIKNPLAIIQLSVEQLSMLSDKMDDKYKRMLEMIRTATQRANKVIGELLDFSRSTKAEFRDVDIPSVINSAISFAENRARNKKIGFVCDFSPEPVKIKGDPILLEQVLINLLNNAIDAIEDSGEISLRTCTQKKNEQPYLIIELRDNGSGMPEDVLSRIFEPFFTTKDQGQGTGLGLTIVYQILQQHEGFIEAESRENHGTTFRIYIPTGLY